MKGLVLELVNPNFGKFLYRQIGLIHQSYPARAFYFNRCYVHHDRLGVELDCFILELLHNIKNRIRVTT